MERERKRMRGCEERGNIEERAEQPTATADTVLRGWIEKKTPDWLVRGRK